MRVIVEPYINFDGDAEQAFNFYQIVFNAQAPRFMRFKDVPQQEGDGWGDAPPDGIMHGAIKVGDTDIMGSDAMPGQYESPGSIYLSWSADDVEEVKRVWQAFVDAGSTVEMDLEKTFWSEVYGILKDPYGVNWMIMHYDPAQVE